MQRLIRLSYFKSDKAENFIQRVFEEDAACMKHLVEA